MGVFSGPRRGAQPPAEERSLVLPDSFATQLANTFAGVDQVTRGTAQQSVAVRTTADTLTSLVSELPLDVYGPSRKGRKTKLAEPPDNVADPGGDGMGAEDWIYRLLMSWLLAGNTYGLPTSWDRLGNPLTADLLHPDDVTVTIVDGAPQWRIRGRLVEKGEPFAHWRVNPVAGRLLGLSVIEAHATTIGVSLAATRFGRQWFTEGAHPSGMLTNDNGLTDTEAETAKKRYTATMYGSREPLILGKGWTWKDIQISPEESQFLETQGFSEAQCARMFGPGWAEILGYQTGSSMTYNNVVDRRQDLSVFSLNRWVRRVDRVLTKLSPKGHAARLNRDAMLEATSLLRMQVHEIALRNKIRTVNEVREIEDLEPVSWGNEPNAPTAPAGGNA
jgi:HK97 family phage portal protein